MTGGSSSKRRAYSVGIDLGTTHTLLAYAPIDAALRPADAADAIDLFEIEQLVGVGEVAARTLLPSLRYQPAAAELSAGDLSLPWQAGAAERPLVVGELARQLGAQVPGRVVVSAKSWLSHDAVDRLAEILPWGGADEVEKISPVAASASYLAHLRAAWNHRHPQHPLEAQDLVLTVPASFDDVARALTLQAARDAGLPELRLLEEPQAALYDWLWRHRRSLLEDLGDSRLVLVCDVGGGTTDLSLVRVELRDGEPTFERVAVGRHLMLGGDNMDLALAHLVEARLAAAGGQAAPSSRLSAGRLSQLVERCRVVKERLLAADAPASATVTLLGRGSRLIGGSQSVELSRDEVLRIVVDGFFPNGGADQLPQRARSGLVAFGLPYASDAAVTRHIAAFLQRHAALGWPDALLLNGGVFRADALAQRLHATLADWRGAPLQPLHNADPDSAVARGAVAYALARRGLAPRIGAGSARAYLLRLDDAGGQRAICVLPQGSEEGHEVRLSGRSFALRTGEPVRFHLLSTTGGGAAGSLQAGDLVDLQQADAQPLPPIATVIRGPRQLAGGSGAGRARPTELNVELVALLTEVGTLEVSCIAIDDPRQRWQLEFQLRDGPAAGAPTALPAHFDQAIEAIDRVFGARDRAAGTRPVKQLRNRLETLLGSRDRWSTELLRPLFDALIERSRGRRRSADHERLWLSLTGWCLRPGFGEALDGWRIEQLWPLFEQGVQHGHDPQVNAEWWTLWRRVAGGLDGAAQQRLLEDFAVNLRGDEAGLERPAHLVKGGWDDMLRLGATLERIPAAHKQEIGDWLLDRIGHLETGRPRAADGWALWAIGRIGTRVPMYGSAHEVVALPAVLRWLDLLLALDWKRVDGAAAAASNLARLSGDRSRDLPPSVCQRVIDRLAAEHAPASWLARVRDVVELDEAGERSIYGEALPPGLKLLG